MLVKDLFFYHVLWIFHIISIIVSSDNSSKKNSSNDD